MNTEDDTFRALAKPPFAQMCKMFNNKFPKDSHFNSIPNEQAFLKEHFWDLKEYKNAVWDDLFDKLITK